MLDTNVQVKLTPEAHKYLRVYKGLNGHSNLSDAANALILGAAQRCPEMFMPSFNKKA